MKKVLRVTLAVLLVTFFLGMTIIVTHRRGGIGCTSKTHWIKAETALCWGESSRPHLFGDVRLPLF